MICGFLCMSMGNLASCRIAIMKNWNIQVAAHKQEPPGPMQLHSTYTGQGSPGRASLKRTTLGRGRRVEVVVHSKIDSEAVRIRGRTTAKTRDAIYPQRNWELHRFALTTWGYGRQRFDLPSQLLRM